MTDFTQKLIQHMKAGYPGIVVRSPEAYRVEACARRAATEMSYEYLRWSITEGWTKAPEGKGEGADPSASIQEIHAKAERTLLVMHVFPEMFRDPNVRQALRDVLAFSKASKKTVLLVGQFEIPQDLEKDLASIEFDLPTREDLASLAKRLCEGNGIKTPENGELTKAVEAALGLTIQEAENAFALSLVRTKRLDPNAILETKKEVVRRSGMLEYIDSKESLATVGGLDALKAWLQMRVQGFGPKARTFGLEPPKGVLLVGLPGCGKSLTAKAIQAAWGLPLLRLDMGRIMTSLVGQSEANLRTTLKMAEAIAPCILWLDEMEKGMAGLGGSSTDGGTTQRVLGSFLTWLQDRSADKPVFVVATANDVSILPPEMLRKGRWDEIFAVDLPNEEERSIIARVHLEKRGRQAIATPDACRQIASATDGFTGSEIEETIKAALWTAFAAEREMTLEDVLEAAGATVPLKTTMSDKIETLRKWAENRARHATSKPQAQPPLSRAIQM